MLLLRSIFFTFLLPGTVTVLIPYWLTSSRRASGFGNNPLRYLGSPLILIGAAGLLWCIWDFFSMGQGTLAPIDPPRRLVVRGPYKYVRNPMYVSVVTILSGEAIFFGSTSILLEAGVFIILAHLFVVLYEEPLLKQKFGESYESYVQSVGRWIPRVLRMNKLILTLLAILICASTGFAQGFTKFDCSVVTLNFDSSNPEVIRKQRVKEIGTFKVDGVGEEQRISRYFRLPGTKGFVVASLYSTDESMASKSGPDSFDMELSLSRRRKRNIFASPAYASSEAPF